MGSSPQPARLHRLLLRLHPRAFRDEYADAIEETLVRRADETRRSGRAAFARFWLREAAGLMGSLVRERLAIRDRGPRRSSRPPIRSLLMPPPLREARHALRRLVRSPGFTVPAALTLALAIGANAAIFSVVRGVVLSPLPYPDSHRLVSLDHGALGLDRPAGLGVTSGLYWQYAERAGTLESVALHQTVEMTVSGDGDAESLPVTRTTATLTRVLRVQPALGRWFDAEEASPGGPAVAVLSHGLWLRRYGGDPDVIGRTLDLAGIATEVIGVMPSGFDYPRSGQARRPTELWIPYPLGPGNVRAGGFNSAGVGG